MCEVNDHTADSPCKATEVWDPSLSTVGNGLNFPRIAVPGSNYFSA